MITTFAFKNVTKFPKRRGIVNYNEFHNKTLKYFMQANMNDAGILIIKLSALPVRPRPVGVRTPRQQVRNFSKFSYIELHAAIKLDNDNQKQNPDFTKLR